MEKANLRVLSIRAGMSPQEKATAIADFNNPNSNVNVLLMNTMVGSAGLNLHYACSYGIQVQMPWSFGCTGQYIGRLVRLKQTKSVTWVILTVNDSAYDWTEHKAAVKEARSLNAQLSFQGWIDEYRLARELACYEAQRVMWSQPFHRMVWEILHPKEIQDFTSDATRTAAKFYSLLAQLFLQTAEPPVDVEQLMKSLKNILPAIPIVWDRNDPTDRDEVTWDQLRALIQGTKSDKDLLKQVNAEQATTDFGTMRKRRVIDLSSDKVPKSNKRKRKDNVDDTPSKKPKSAATVTVSDLEDDEFPDLDSPPRNLSDSDDESVFDPENPAHAEVGPGKPFETEADKLEAVRRWKEAEKEEEEREKHAREQTKLAIQVTKQTGGMGGSLF